MNLTVATKSVDRQLSLAHGRCKSPVFYCYLLLVLSALITASSMVSAQGEEYLEMQVSTPYSFEDFSSYLSYIEDTDHSIVVEDCCGPAGVAWQKLQQDRIDFGFSTAKFWLKLPVKNMSDREGLWLIDFNSRFMNGLEAYLIDFEHSELILFDSENKTFDEREIKHRQLVAEIILKPGQRADIVIGYWSRGTTVLPLLIETEKTFYQQWISDNITIVAFYSALFFMICFGLAQYVVLKKPVQLTYALYVAAGGLYVFHMDGLSFQYFWPSLPGWNADASLVIGLNIGVFSIIFSRTFLKTSAVMPRVDKLLLSILIITILLMLSTFLFDLSRVKQFGFLVTTLTIFICMLTGVFAYLRGQKEARFYVLGWIGLFLSAGFATVSHLIEKVLPIPLTFDFAKVGIFVDGIMFAMAMADQANEVRKQRDLAHERERVLLEQDLEAQKQMIALEKKYQGALSLAQQKSYALASAGHDLRQPIFALKTAMNHVTERDGADVKTIGQFQQGFDYIEKLIKEYLENPDELRQGPKEHDVEYQGSTLEQNSHDDLVKNAEEDFCIGVVLSNVAMMFRENAEKNSIEFSCVQSSASIRANPVIVMRILSNLVENAIKYTEKETDKRKGKVIVGCRRRKKYLDVQVLDSGNGFSNEEKEKYFDAYQRGGDSDIEGVGLGLSIVRKLAASEGYNLVLHTQKGKGSLFQISIPLTDTA